jgi:pantothenate kinase-related protein Tda10
MIYELLQLIRGEPFRLFNLCGPQGLGKSRLTLELLCILNERDAFKDGIVYVDLDGVDTLEAFKERLRIKLACTSSEDKAEVGDGIDGCDRAPKQCN